MSVIPHRFLFRYSFPVQRVAQMPRKGRKLLDLSAACLLPSLAELEAEACFAEVYAGWNEEGVGLAITVSGKSAAFSCREDAPAESDGLQIWIDTRNTQSIHRASRFCHHFCILPSGGGKKSDQPIAIQLPIARAREESSTTAQKKIRVAALQRKDGYHLEAWLPGDVLHGYDPQANPLLGFYYVVRDVELGEQYLSVGRDFPFAHDPSLWSTLELQGE